MPDTTLFTDPTLIAVAALVGLVIVAAALLRAWNGWLAFKRLELQHRHGDMPAVGLIEVADLKERIRKLEAIASGVDL